MSENLISKLFIKYLRRTFTKEPDYQTATFSSGCKITFEVCYKSLELSSKGSSVFLASRPSNVHCSVHKSPLVDSTWIRPIQSTILCFIALNIHTNIHPHPGLRVPSSFFFSWFSKCNKRIFHFSYARYTIHILHLLDLMIFVIYCKEESQFPVTSSVLGQIFIPWNRFQAY